MIGLLCFVLAVLASPFKSKLRLEAENAVLRHQLMVLRRRLQGRIRLTNHDRWFFIQLYRWFPSILQVLTIIRPETLLRWHRVGFRFYWRWKSRHGAACLQDLMLKGPAGAQSLWQSLQQNELPKAMCPMEGQPVRIAVPKPPPEEAGWPANHRGRLSARQASYGLPGEAGVDRLTVGDARRQCLGFVRHECGGCGD
jgi:hypothetical protein